MRVLVACAACKRQYDAGTLGAGSVFRCRCGATVRVPRPAARDAAVVRCSSCGSPRSGGGATCRFCGSDFTIHEQDIDTVCPECMARLPRRARYCHHCAIPIAPEEIAGGATDAPCPACAKASQLRSRRLGAPELSLLECTRCGGLWLGNESFGIVLEKARREATPVDGSRPLPPPGATGRPVRPGATAYRRCPRCSQQMHRFNYGKRSGVILDSCRDHGVWCDAHELEALLRWIRAGGEARVREALALETRDDPGSRYFRQKIDQMAAGASHGTARRDADDLGGLLGRLFDL